MSWARPEFDAERRNALAQGLLIGVSEQPATGRLLLHVFIPMTMNIVGLRLIGPSDRVALVHKSPKPGYKHWQLTFFVGQVMGGDACFDTPQQALDHARGLGLIVETVKAL